MRRTWFLHLLHQGPTERACLMVGDDGYVGAMLRESQRGVEGFRFPEGQEPLPCDATSLDDALLGIRDAFRLDRLQAEPMHGGMAN